MTFKLYVNLFYSLQTTSSFSHFRSSTKYIYLGVTTAVIVTKRLIENFQAVKNNLHYQKIKKIKKSDVADVLKSMSFELASIT